MQVQAVLKTENRKCWGGTCLASTLVCHDLWSPLHSFVLEALMNLSLSSLIKPATPQWNTDSADQTNRWPLQGIFMSSMSRCQHVFGANLSPTFVSRHSDVNSSRALCQITWLAPLSKRQAATGIPGARWYLDVASLYWACELALLFKHVLGLPCQWITGLSRRQAEEWCEPPALLHSLNPGFLP